VEERRHGGHQSGGRSDHRCELGRGHEPAVMSAWTRAMTAVQKAARVEVGRMGCFCSSLASPTVGKLTYRPEVLYCTLLDPRAAVTRIVIFASVAMF
jgi:hypothetical protein